MVELCSAYDKPSSTTLSIITHGITIEHKPIKALLSKSKDPVDPGRKRKQVSPITEIPNPQAVTHYRAAAGLEPGHARGG